MMIKMNKCELTRVGHRLRIGCSSCGWDSWIRWDRSWPAAGVRDGDRRRWRRCRRGRTGRRRYWDRLAAVRCCAAASRSAVGSKRSRRASRIYPLSSMAAIPIISNQIQSKSIKLIRCTTFITCFSMLKCYFDYLFCREISLEELKQ